MTTTPCVCSTATCGCCEGTGKLTPEPTANRPGLPGLRYRVGTHGTFLETMKAALAGVTVEAPGPDGQTLERFQPLRGLTTRDPGDFAIALLDGWATVGDVLTFYQERIANEGYLRTATERRSILELARLVGYTLRPGVAATVYLAYTLEDQQTEPVQIPAGSRAQSIPGPGELPQSFETSETLEARAEWSNLQIRLTQPQNIELANALTLQELYLSGTTLNLKAGDALLLVFGDDGDPAVLRTIAIAETRFETGRTVVQFQPPATGVAEAMPALLDFLAAAGPLFDATDQTGEGRVLVQAQALVTNAFLGLPSPPEGWVGEIISAADQPVDAVLEDLIEKLAEDVSDALGQTAPPTPPPVTKPSAFVKDLLKPRVPQVASGIQLRRTPALALAPGADTHARVLVNLAPTLKDTFYTAWRNANVSDAPSALKGVYALRLAVPLFGTSVPKLPTYYVTDEEGPAGNLLHVAGEVRPPNEWIDWTLEADEDLPALFLDQAHEEIAPGGYVVLQTSVSGFSRCQLHSVTAVQTMQRTAYGVSGRTTRLTLAETWWAGSGDSMANLRGTLVYGQSEPLTLSEEPIAAEVKGQRLVLATLYDGLASGRWIILSGERADIPGVSGVKASELLMISGVEQGYDPTLPGDTTRTTLILATEPAYAYQRATLTIYGNVVKATHGETRKETLGSGDGRQPLQTFTLKQPPLTFVSAPTVSGTESTLQVYVNDVEWREVETLAGLQPHDRRFITRTDDEARVSVVFGTGQAGARLPTGVENVMASYRSGIGKPGNVLAEQISLLQTKPLGVKGVINPLRASGGADREGRDQARENAPLTVMALDRLVSVEDYADFTRMFAGIGKATARQLSDGQREIVHITVAGAEDIPIDPESDPYRNLIAALRRYGDPDLPVLVASRELVLLVASANVRLMPDYQWDSVATAIRTKVLDGFGFQRRALGQPALLCEIIGAIQSVPGVAYLDVDAFGGIPEKRGDQQGTRTLLTLEELADAVEEIAQSTGAAPAQRVEVNVADLEGRVVRPAQLAIFTPAVPDTLILNQIL